MINLDENYYIDSDKYCYRLVTKGGADKDGNPIWKPIGYYTTLPAVIDSYANIVLRNEVDKNDCKIENLMKRLYDLKKVYNDTLYLTKNI